MIYIKNSILIILLCLLTQTSQGQNKKENSFRSPVDFPIKLAGNFGELRPDHFHSGIDIKTYGMRGKKIYAIADGYISRIKITTGGYGKAIYIHHPEAGITSVFGHLKSFSQPIKKYIIENQYNKKQHEIQLFPEPDKFPVKKGDIIAYSGNSGRSGGPHIHFEIRNLSNQHPQNPMLYDFDIEDNIPPKIFNLGVYKHNSNKPPREKQILDVVAGPENTFRLKRQDTLHLSGSYSFGIRAFDFLNDVSNWCGIYDLKLKIDGSPIYHHRLDEFSFSETRYINSLIDYEASVKNNLSIQESYIQPNNRLSIYQYVKGKGVLDFNKGKTHKLEYIAEDVYGNQSSLTFYVSNKKPNPPKYDTPGDTMEYKKTMPFDQNNSYSTSFIKVNFPANTFYDTLYFNHKRQPIDNPHFLSEIHHVHNRYTPVHKHFSLSIKTKNLQNELRKKAFLARIDQEGEYQYEGGEFLNGFISSSVRNFGKYVVMVDTVAPEIEHIGSFSDMKGKQTLRFHVKDDLSGIDTYNAYIDGEWVLFEYDPKNELLIHHFDTHQLESGETHEIELYVGDKRNNIATFYQTFTR